LAVEQVLKRHSRFHHGLPLVLVELVAIEKSLEAALALKVQDEVVPLGARDLAVLLQLF